jgi:predicted phosphoribosyltransferase/alpha-beta hydrolase superfamily lysophospholipase
MFTDRADAGRQLAARLLDAGIEMPVVSAIPRGGVPVAAQIAASLDAPLDVVVVRKLGVPWHPELGFGAIGEEHVLVTNDELIGALGLDADDVEGVVRLAREELATGVEAFRGHGSAVDVHGRIALLVDDGVATGYTALAAIEVLRRRGAARVIVAAPVASPIIVPTLRAAADDVVILDEPQAFAAVGQFYRDFGQVSDEEVRRSLDAFTTSRRPVEHTQDGAVELSIDGVSLPGVLDVPDDADGIVVFAHGSGSSHRSIRNRSVAGVLQASGLATLLFDLLTPAEAADRRNVFDVELLARRLVDATRWVRDRAIVRGRPLGCFGASTGAAAALWAAADLGDDVAAIVSRGGRPDLAMPRLGAVVAPTLLIVGSADETVLELNRAAQRTLAAPSELAVIWGATHLFEEPGALAEVSTLAADWFRRQFTARLPRPALR